MPKASSPPDFSLFVAILRTLEAIQAPYMIIGAFAATLYGITRTTYFKPRQPSPPDFDEAHVTTQAIALGPEVAELWQAIRQAAQQATDPTEA